MPITKSWLYALYTLHTICVRTSTRSGPSALDRFAVPGKNEFLLFEPGLNQRQEKAAWLAERYGTEINFASVAPADVVAVDAIRRGIHRKADYRAMM